MMDTYQIFLITGLGIILVFGVLLPLFFQKKHEYMFRYFRQKTNVRLPLVKDLTKEVSAIPSDLSEIEMVAVLTLISLDKTVSETHAVAQRFATNGWQGKFDDEFFDRLDSTARAFSARGWNRAGIDLFRLGQQIAESNGNSHWVREFSATIQRLQYQQVQSGLPNKMK